MISEIFVKYCIFGRDKNNQLICKNVYQNILYYVDVGSIFIVGHGLKGRYH